MYKKKRTMNRTHLEEEGLCVESVVLFVRKTVVDPSIAGVYRLWDARMDHKCTCLSSFTGAPNLGNEGTSVFSLAYSKHLVHKI